jgi:hypothetical protein
MAEQRNELGTKIAAWLHECAGFDGDAIAQDRVKALNYYLQRERGDEQAGRSRVIAGDVSAMVESNLAQMLESFSSPDLAEFQAVSEQDDDQAALESAVVTDFIMNRNNGYHELGSAIKDGLLLRNGWVYIDVEETPITETLELENATGEAIAELHNNTALNVKVLEFDEKAATAKIRVTQVFRKFLFQAEDPANVLYPKNYNSVDVQEIPFIARRHLETRDKLIRRGFPKTKVRRLKAYDQDSKIDSMARDVRQDVATETPIDESQERIEWFECYVLVDSGDGTSERRRIAVAGVNKDAILENVPVTLVPLATGSPFINPHRLTGISLFDKLRQGQDINTSLTRALLDNVNTVIKNRTAYLDGKVNVEDLEDGRPNGNIRVRASVGDVRSAITPFAQPDISAGILQNLNYQRQVRSEMGGASLELATGQMQMSGGRIGSQGVDRAFSVMEQLAAHMTKNMAQTLIRSSWLLAHAMIRQFYDEPVEIKRNGRWRSAVPSTWPARSAVNVRVGMSPNERARKVATMKTILDSQIGLAREGMSGQLVDAERFYKAVTDYARLADIPNPEQYYIDPQSEPAKQAAQAQAQKAESESQASRALMSQAVGLEQLRAAMEKYKTDVEYQFKYWAETIRAEIAEAQIVGKATADLIKQTKFGANGNAGTDQAGDTSNAGPD